MTYQIFKEVNGEFQDTGETQPDLASAQARMAALSVDGVSYSANESNALAALYAVADAWGLARGLLFNPVVDSGVLNMLITGNLEAAAVIVGSLRADNSVVLAVQGDSTSVNSTDVDTPTRWFRDLVVRLAGALPAAHVMYKAWSLVTQDYGPWFTLQTAKAGRRHALFTGSAGVANRTRAQPATQVGDFTGDVDFRINLALDNWVPGTVSTVMARMGGIGSRGWYLRLAANGDLTFLWNPNPASEVTLSVTAPASTVAGVNGVAQWLRASLDIDNGQGGYTAALYKSPDGVTWTQIAQVLTTNGVTQVGNPVGTDYELGGRGASNEMVAGKVYETQLRAGLGGTIMDVQPIENWTTTNACALGGAPTLYAVNGSEVGKNLAYFTDPTRFKMMVIPAAPAAVYLNTGHNEGALHGVTLKTALDAWLAQFYARTLSDAVIVAQNPEVAPASPSASNANQRAREIGSWAVRNGLGVLDAGAAIGRTQDIAGNTTSDGVHPNQSGYFLIGADAFKPYTSLL